MVGGGEGANKSVRQEKALVKAGITGFTVLCEMLSGGLFMENVKMEKQRTSDPYPTIMGRILRQGVKGFEVGFWPWGAIMGLSKGIVLGGARAGFLNTFLDFGMPKGHADVISGFCAGGVQGMVMSPILLARTRVNQLLTERAAEQGRIKTSFIHEMNISMSILNESIRKDGFRVLTIGMPTMIFKRSMDWGTRFLFMRYLRKAYYEYKQDSSKKLNDLEELSVAFVAGALSVFVTQPVDRLMPLLQAAGRGDASFNHIIRMKLLNEGWGTLQRGLVLRTLHCGWHTTWAVFIATKLYDIVEKVPK